VARHITPCTGLKSGAFDSEVLPRQPPNRPQVLARLARPGAMLLLLIVVPAAPAAAHSAGVFSDPMEPGESWTAHFDEPARVQYRTLADQTLPGRFEVRPGLDAQDITIAIRDDPLRFEPNNMQVGVGSNVTWFNAGNRTHTLNGSATHLDEQATADNADGGTEDTPVAPMPLLAGALALLALARRR